MIIMVQHLKTHVCVCVCVFESMCVSTCDFSQDQWWWKN